MKNIKIVLALLLAVSMLVTFAACSKKAETTQDASTAVQTSQAGESTASTESEAPKLKVAMVCSGSLGDTGIFDLGNEGLTKAQSDFGIEYKVLEGKNDPSLYYDLLKTAASQFDMIFVNPGYQFDNYLKEIATANPDKMFVYADGVSSLDMDNIVSVCYKENEGSYLAGVMAAMMTTRTEIKGINDKKVLGFVGAMDMPTINNFLAGFKAGVESVDSQIVVKPLYVGSFNDPAKGKELANSLFDQGADIVYQAAATSGDGVTAAAKEKGMYTIGVDTDRSPLAPENVMGSMLKNVGTSFYDVVDTYIKDGKLEKVQKKGLGDKWVDLYFDDFMKSLLPEDVSKAITTAQDDIISAKLTVPEAK